MRAATHQKGTPEVRSIKDKFFSGTIRALDFDMICNWHPMSPQGMKTVPFKKNILD